MICPECGFPKLCEPCFVCSCRSIADEIISEIKTEANK